MTHFKTDLGFNEMFTRSSERWIVDMTNRGDPIVGLDRLAKLWVDSGNTEVSWNYGQGRNAAGTDYIEAMGPQAHALLVTPGHRLLGTVADSVVFAVPADMVVCDDVRVEPVGDLNWQIVGDDHGA